MEGKRWRENIEGKALPENIEGKALTGAFLFQQT